MDVRIFMIAFGFITSLVQDGVAFVVEFRPANELRPRQQPKNIRVLTKKRQNKVCRMSSEVDPEDTVRVRIWRALSESPGKELTMKELGTKVGERRPSELWSHLKHVQKQSQTIQNKSSDWKERRGLSASKKDLVRWRVQIRRGRKSEIYIKLS